MDIIKSALFDGAVRDIIGVFDATVVSASLVRPTTSLSGSVTKELKSTDHLTKDILSTTLDIQYNDIINDFNTQQPSIVDSIDEIIINRIKSMAINNTQPSITLPSLNPVFKASYKKAIDTIIQKIHETTSLQFEPFIIVANNIIADFNSVTDLENHHVCSQTCHKGNTRPYGTYGNVVVYSTTFFDNAIVIGIKGKNRSASGIAVSYTDNILTRAEDGKAVVAFDIFSDELSEHFFNIINVG